jgi:hypothetical protein
MAGLCLEESRLANLDRTRAAPAIEGESLFKPLRRRFCWQNRHHEPDCEKAGEKRDATRR